MGVALERWRIKGYGETGGENEYWPLPTNVPLEPGRQMKPPEHTDIMPQYLNQAGYPQPQQLLIIKSSSLPFIIRFTFSAFHS
jgi:hypothetical protein